MFVGLPQDVDLADLARMIAEGHAWEHFKHLSGFDDPSDLEDLLRAGWPVFNPAPVPVPLLVG